MPHRVSLSSPCRASVGDDDDDGAGVSSECALVLATGADADEDVGGDEARAGTGQAEYLNWRRLESWSVEMPLGLASPSRSDRRMRAS